MLTVTKRVSVCVRIKKDNPHPQPSLDWEGRLIFINDKNRREVVLIVDPLPDDIFGQNLLIGTIRRRFDRGDLWQQTTSQWYECDGDLYVLGLQPKISFLDFVIACCRAFAGYKEDEISWNPHDFKYEELTADGLTIAQYLEKKVMAGS